MVSDKTKYRKIIEMNTFYFSNPEFESRYESELHSMKETLLYLHNQIKEYGLRKNVFVQFLREKKQGLRALLTLTGISNEYLKRLITFIRVIDDKELSRTVLKDKWCEKKDGELSEWSDSKISRLINENISFAKGIVNLFFEGGSLPVLARALPTFELKKLSIGKLGFSFEEMIDTIIRYKQKGSYSGKRENNPDEYLKQILRTEDIPFESGDLPILVSLETERKRTIDIIIPDREAPKILVECSYAITTSSAQGDKSKAEIGMRGLLKQYFPRTFFLGFIDGIGWYVRKNDLERMVRAFDDVFTFQKKEIKRFIKFVRLRLKK